MSIDDIYGFYYEVITYSQVLKHGTWGSDDCDWDWEEESEVFCGYDYAKNHLEHIPLSNDTPMARLYRFELDRYHCRCNEELLIERNF